MELPNTWKWVLIFSIIIPTLTIGIVWLTVDFCKFRKRRIESRSGKQNKFYHYGKKSKRLDFPHSLPKGMSILKMLPDASVQRLRRASAQYDTLNVSDGTCSCKLKGGETTKSDKESLIKTNPLIITVNGHHVTEINSYEDKQDRYIEVDDKTTNPSVNEDPNEIVSTKDAQQDRMCETRLSLAHISDEELNMHENENKAENLPPNGLIRNNSNGRTMVHQIGTANIRKTGMPRERLLSTSSYRDDDVFLVPSDRLSLFSNASVITPSCLDFTCMSVDTESIKSSYLDKLKVKHNGKNFPLRICPSPSSSFNIETQHPVARDLAKLMEQQNGQLNYKLKCQQYVDDEKNCEFKSEKPTYFETLRNKQNGKTFETQYSVDKDFSDDCEKKSYFQKLKNKQNGTKTIDYLSLNGYTSDDSDKMSYLDKLKEKQKEKQKEVTTTSKCLPLNNSTCTSDGSVKLPYLENLQEKQNEISFKCLHVNDNNSEGSGKLPYLEILKAKQKMTTDQSIPKNGYASDDSDKMSYLEKLKDKRDQLLSAVSLIVKNDEDSCQMLTNCENITEKTQQVDIINGSKKFTYLDTLKHKRTIDI